MYYSLQSINEDVKLKEISWVPATLLSTEGAISMAVHGNGTAWVGTGFSGMAIGTYRPKLGHIATRQGRYEKCEIV